MCLDAKRLEFKNSSDNRPIKLFYQDEARFGRIDNISSCWVPKGKRALVGNQIIRKYTYAYFAICPETGENYSLILPYANGACMDIFMQGLSQHFKNYRIILAMDRASWHTGNKIKKWKNIVPLFNPPYSPELNPVENIWHHIRETYGFKNKTFDSIEQVEKQLENALKDLYHDKETVKSITLFDWIYSAIC
jgi:transposase